MLRTTEQNRKKKTIMTANAAEITNDNNEAHAFHLVKILLIFLMVGLVVVLVVRAIARKISVLRSLVDQRELFFRQCERPRSSNKKEKFVTGDLLLFSADIHFTRFKSLCINAIPFIFTESFISHVAMVVVDEKDGAPYCWEFGIGENDPDCVRYTKLKERVKRYNGNVCLQRLHIARRDETTRKITHYSRDNSLLDPRKLKRFFRFRDELLKNKKDIYYNWHFFFESYESVLSENDLFLRYFFPPVPYINRNILNRVASSSSSLGFLRSDGAREKKPPRQKKYICSDFVIESLDRLGILDMSKNWHLFPKDFLRIFPRSVGHNHNEFLQSSSSTAMPTTRGLRLINNVDFYYGKRVLLKKKK